MGLAEGAPSGATDLSRAAGPEAVLEPVLGGVVALVPGAEAAPAPFPGRGCPGVQDGLRVGAAAAVGAASVAVADAGRGAGRGLVVRIAPDGPCERGEGAAAVGAAVAVRTSGPFGAGPGPGGADVVT